MTDRTDDATRTIERALIEGARLRMEEPPPDLNVVPRVMQTIRRSVPAPTDWTASTGLDQLVWRTATIAAAVVLVITILMAGVRGTSPLAPASLLAEDFESSPLFGE